MRTTGSEKERERERERDRKRERGEGGEREKRLFNTQIEREPEKNETALELLKYLESFSVDAP